MNGIKLMIHQLMYSQQVVCGFEKIMGNIKNGINFWDLRGFNDFLEMIWKSFWIEKNKKIHPKGLEWFLSSFYCVICYFSDNLRLWNGECWLLRVDSESLGLCNRFKTWLHLFDSLRTLEINLKRLQIVKNMKEDKQVFLI